MSRNFELLNFIESESYIDTSYNKRKLVLKGTLPEQKAGPKGKILIEEIRRGYIVKSLEGPYHPFGRFKPIFVLSDEGTSDRNLSIVVEALEEVLDSVNMKDIIPIHVFGYWNEGKGPHQSVEWYIQRAFNARRKEYDINRKGQCDIEQFWEDLRKDPIQKIRPHYDVLVLSDFDLFSTDPRYNYRFMIGEGREEGTVLGITRYKNSGDEIVRQGALHEFGHTFADLDHCGQVEDGSKGECTMKFPNAIPHDLEVQAKYRKNKGILFCNEHNLRMYEVRGDKEHLKAFPEIKKLYEAICALNPALLKAIDRGELALLETRVKLK